MRSAVRPKGLSPAIDEAPSEDVAPGVLGGDRAHTEAHARHVSVDLDRSRHLHDDRYRPAPVNTLPPARVEADSRLAPPGADLNGDHLALEDQRSYVAMSEGTSHPRTDSRGISADPSDALLLILADRLNDIEGLRKATGNQLAALTRSSDIAGGKGLSEHSKAAVSMADWLALLEREEHQVVLQLQRALRLHPLGRWVKDTVGIGEKQGARLIAAIGDPAWNHAADRPRRGPAELWAYCGYAPEQKRRKGVQSNWNAEAKMRAFLCAESCIKQTGGADRSSSPEGVTRSRSPFRDEYDKARANWVDRDTSDAHKHQHALRCVAKAILKDLWLAARAIELAHSEAATSVSANGVNEREAAA